MYGNMKINSARLNSNECSTQITPYLYHLGHGYVVQVCILYQCASVITLITLYMLHSSTPMKILRTLPLEPLIVHPSLPHHPLVSSWLSSCV